MSNLQFAVVLVILIYQCWQVSRAADGGFVKHRLDSIEGKLDAILKGRGYGAE